jgi:hypothetical protein
MNFFNLADIADTFFKIKLRKKIPEKPVFIFL